MCLIKITIPIDPHFTHTPFKFTMGGASNRTEGIGMHTTTPRGGATMTPHDSVIMMMMMMI